MIDRLAERGFQIPNAGDDAGIHECGEVLKAICLVEQRAEFTQVLYVLLGEFGHVGLRQDFDQRDFQRRKRRGAVQSIASCCSHWPGTRGWR